MRIKTTKMLPPVKELAQILKQEFSGQYSYKLFGLGQKTILVGKSTLVGAQITVRANEITIHATPPSIMASWLALLGLTELGFVLIFVLIKFWALPSHWRELEKEIGIFLTQRFN